MLKIIMLTVVALVALTGSSSAQWGTGSNSESYPRSPYVDRNGHYHAPSRQTIPNGTQRDNFGARGNYNPYTGRIGRGTPRY
jgi:hypothetical protein